MPPQDEAFDVFQSALRLYRLYAAHHLSRAAPGWARWRVRAGLVPHFLWVAWRHRDDARRPSDPLARKRIKHALDLTEPPPAPFVPRALDPSPPITPPDGAALTLVMPVYARDGTSLAMTREALRRALEHTSLPFRLVLLDDASPCPEALPALRAIAARHPEILLLENATNLGFVATVNRGFAAARDWPDDPVVLLNSDAFVPPDWAPRLLRPIWQDARVASVTPLSNDAELGSVPVPGRAREIPPQVAGAVDAHARTLGGGMMAEAPTGVGFCMALSPRALAALPAFDMAFSPGYGEEVDWCQRLLKQGFRHVYVPDLFVAHMGGASFGRAAKRALIARHSARLSRRYPRFDASVQAVLRADPLASARLSLGLAWAEAARRGPLPVYLGHDMGGGAEIDLRRRVARDVTEIGGAVVLRVGGLHAVAVELWSADAPGLPERAAVGCADWRQVAALLRPVTQRALVYSCGVGEADALTLPARFQALRGPQDSLTVLLHDYFAVSPSMTLLDAAGRWRGVPLAAAAAAEEAEEGGHTTLRPDGTPVSLAEWQAAWGGLLRAATRVEAFSEATARLVRTAYPGLAVTVRPHSLPVVVPALPVQAAGPPVLGVLGNLAPHKGAGVTEALSRALKGRGVGLVHLGKIDPQHRLHRPAVAHGAYAVEDLPALVAHHRITCWLIPSVWPETFSFTTHEALATGLPVMVFDLGAQAEAVRKAIAAGAPGAVLPLAMAHDPQAILAEAARLSDRVSRAKPSAGPDPA